MSKQKAKVECLECGRKFETSSILSTCPKCGGSDIDIKIEIAPSGKFAEVQWRDRP